SRVRLRRSYAGACGQAVIARRVSHRDRPRLSQSEFYRARNTPVHERRARRLEFAQFLSLSQLRVVGRGQALIGGAKGYGARPGAGLQLAFAQLVAPVGATPTTST